MSLAAIPKVFSLRLPWPRQQPDPHWIKVFRDLRTSKSRTLLVALSIMVGVSAIGTIGGARVLLLDSMAQNVARLNPPAAVLQTDAMPEGMLAALRGLPGVATVSGRMLLPVRIKLPEAPWRDVNLFAISSYASDPLNHVFPQTGAWPPQRGQMLFERASYAFMGAHTGDTAVVELAGGRQQRLTVAGTALDTSLTTPDTFYGQVNAFASMDTLDWLGVPRSINQVYVQTSDPSDRAASRAIEARVRGQLEASGVVVNSVVVPKPQQLWSAGAVDSLLFLLGLLGTVLVFMSIFLVINMASALLTQQIRHIGIMKSIGAGTSQMMAMYLTMVFIFGVLAVLIGVPLGALGAKSLLDTGAKTLNFDESAFTIDPWVLALQLFAGLVLPVLAALPAVLGGSRITIREAITGGSSGRFGGGRLERLLLRLALPPRILLSMRNLLRRKARLALTMSGLVLAGAFFVAVGTSQSSIVLTNRDQFAYKHYDVQVQLSHATPAVAAEAQALAVPGVTGAEAWQVQPATRLRPDGSQSDTFTLVGPPPGSAFIQPILLAGRWLQPQDRDSVVINTDLTHDETDLQVGGSLTVEAQKKRTVWHIVGLVRGVVAGPTAYASYQGLAAAVGEQGQAREIELATAKHDSASQMQVARAVETRFNQANIPIAQTVSMAERQAFNSKGWAVIVSFLLDMAVLLAVVGGLGLLGTMSINVVERTREIGVMRAIGASTASIMAIVIGEGVAIGIASWFVAALISIPVSRLLSDELGNQFANTPLTFSYSTQWLLAWLVLVIAIAAISSFVPARRAARLTVRDVLNYEG